MSVRTIGKAHRVEEDATAATSKAARFRRLLHSPNLDFLLEAHNGLSAKVVEEAGFEGIWASGLAIASALGVRDNNEASWTQVLEMLEFMSDSTTIPILVDGDTGYGNFNNVRRLVHKLGQRDIAAVCIEDKQFPKANSFVGNVQPLADIDEFCGKIKAGKDSQLDDDFCLIARVEALIAGHGMDEALRRAEAYHGAGADGILIHSKLPTVDEIAGFAQAWGNRCPLVIVPTMYHRTPTDRYRALDISIAIWANQTLRASLKAMRDTAMAIKDEEGVAGIEDAIASMGDVFDIAGNKELADAERRYLCSAQRTVGAVVLAAARGSQLDPLTEDRPKCMIDVRGQPLLTRLVGTLREGGVGTITVVRGYAKAAIDLATIDTVDNDDFATTGEAASLACAADELVGETVVAYGDILFKRLVLDDLMTADGDIVLACDALGRGKDHRMAGRPVDLVAGSRPCRDDYLDDEPVLLTGIGDALAPADVDAEWIGLARLSAVGAGRVRAELDRMAADGSLPNASLLDLFRRLLDNGEDIRIVYIAGQWLDVDDAFDLAQARNLT